MKTFFLGQEYVAISLIRVKDKIFHEKFITISELNEFCHYLQQEFNNRDLDVIITSNTLSIEDFNIIGDVIIASNNCCINLGFLPMNVLSILSDTNLTKDFLMQFEKEKLEAIEIRKSAASKL